MARRSSAEWPDRSLPLGRYWLGAIALLAPWAGRQPLAPTVARLGCYRGIAEVTGLVLAAEVVVRHVDSPAHPLGGRFHRFCGSCAGGYWRRATLQLRRLAPQVTAASPLRFPVPGTR